MFATAIFGVYCAGLVASASSFSISNDARPMDAMEHIVIFMQENRPFDHYFGTLKGVRGFNDRVTVPMKNGFNAFYQPISERLEEYMLPFRTDSNKTNAMCMPAPEMYYPTDIKMWNDGRMDSWNTARDPGYGMSYFTREDLPYYYALADNFVCGDYYFQSTFTCTNPNRMHLFTGSNGLSVGEDAVLENDEPRPGYDWVTMGEILEAANISWRVYQQLDNFDDNAFAWFAKYQQSRPGEPLFDKGMMRQRSVFEAFDADLRNGELPQVSWIIAPTEKSEHATNHPAAGEDWTAQLLSILSSYPDVYAKTAFILDYDEGGQFFDHVWSPTPPLSVSEGVATVSVEGEVNTDVLTTFPAPIGLGFRVPLIIVSPWTRGDLVVSEVFDHTSVIQLVEQRFGVHCPNISPWRRTITGNLLSAFDFENPDYSWPMLPDTSGYVKEADIECHTLPDPVIPSQQSMPVQEPGTKRSRALPYEFLVTDELDSESKLSAFRSPKAFSPSLTLALANTGKAGAPFVLFNQLNISLEQPRIYAVESSKSITDTLTLVNSTYSYHLQGPNGFVRIFAGDISKSKCSAKASLKYSPGTSEIVLQLSSSVSGTTFLVTDNAYGLLSPSKIVVSDINVPVEWRLNVSSVGHWYDLSARIDVSEREEHRALSASSRTSATTAESSELDCFFRRFLGRMETGEDGISDPAMAAAIPGLSPLLKAGHPEEHPQLPERLRRLKRPSDVGTRATGRRIQKDELFQATEVGGLGDFSAPSRSP